MPRRPDSGPTRPRSDRASSTARSRAISSRDAAAATEVDARSEEGDGAADVLSDNGAGGRVDGTMRADCPDVSTDDSRRSASASRADGVSSLLPSAVTLKRSLALSAICVAAAAAAVSVAAAVSSGTGSSRTDVADPGTARDIAGTEPGVRPWGGRVAIAIDVAALPICASASVENSPRRTPALGDGQAVAGESSRVTAEPMASSRRWLVGARSAGIRVEDKPFGDAK